MHQWSFLIYSKLLSTIRVLPMHTTLCDLSAHTILCDLSEPTTLCDLSMPTTIGSRPTFTTYSPYIQTKTYLALPEHDLCIVNFDSAINSPALYTIE